MHKNYNTTKTKQIHSLVKTVISLFMYVSYVSEQTTCKCKKQKTCKEVWGVQKPFHSQYQITVAHARINYPLPCSQLKNYFHMI